LITYVGLSDFAEYDEAGNQSKNPKFPFSLRFQPDKSVSTLFPKDLPNGGYMSFVDQLKSVPGDSTLYNVYAMDQPKELGGKESHIGDLVMEGILTSSVFGDEKLFFRHQKMDDDVKLQPSWGKYLKGFYHWPW